jgi:MFS family permease
VSRSTSGFRALLATQALSAFNHNLLRSALITLAAFGTLDDAGLSSETTIALSTLFLVAPYAVLSLPAGRLADRFAKASLIRWTKSFEIVVFGIAGAGLLLMNVPVLLLAVLLAGIEAAIFGPAKFGILPELLTKRDLIAGNAWVSASSTIAILAGLVSGNLLASSDAGIGTIIAGGVGLAVLGWAICFRIPVTAPKAPDLAISLPVFIADFRTCFRRLAALPALLLPVFGCSWFWFQGAVNTSLMPLYVAQTPGLPESIVSILLVASSLGVAAGAVCARWLEGGPVAKFLPPAALAVICIPGIDLWLGGPISDIADVVRPAFDFFILAAGCGLYVVPLTTAVQQLTPDGERARFIGLNHTLNGIAMMVSGFVVLLLNLPGMSVELIFGLTALVSGIVAASALLSTMPALAGPRISAISQDG